MSPTRITTGRTVRWTAACLAAVLALSACSASNSATSTPKGSSSPKACGTINIAVNPWVGYQANAAVVAYLAETKLGCTVKLKDLTEDQSWQGLDSGDVDVILENWGHEDLKKTYIEEKKTALSAGPSGNTGAIGWYVPPWMKAEYPDITDWRNLNKYASLFQSPESAGKGQLLDGDPSYVTNDEALVANLGLNYKVVYAGTEFALIKAFRQAEEKRQPLLGYFFEPQWLHLDIQLVKINLPAYSEGCDADPKKVACDYPGYQLDKIVSKKFETAGGPAYDLVKKFQWSNAEQNTVASFIDMYKMTPKEAAKRWAEANPDRVEEWLGEALGNQ